MTVEKPYKNGVSRKLTQKYHNTFSVIVETEKNYIKMSNNNFFLTMIVLTFTCISSRHLLFFSEATNLQRKVSLISQPTTTVSTPTPTQQSGNKTDKPKSLSSHLSMAAESGLTFISVFIFGCVIIASVYSWKKFSESSWG